MNTRSKQAKEVRINAANLAFKKGTPSHISNGEESLYPNYLANFTKGLPHDERGILLEPRDYEKFVAAIDSGEVSDFRALRLGPGPFDVDGNYSVFHNEVPVHNWAQSANRDARVEVRAWESQGAGLTFDLEGPDAQAVTMPPAPKLDSAELAAEMAEIYWMALLRDIPFDQFDSVHNVDPNVKSAAESLATFDWFRGEFCERLTDAERKRARNHVDNNKNSIPLNKLFRGITKGDDVGPYISQFLLVGNTGINAGDNQPRCVSTGLISYGAIHIDQKVRIAKPGVDFMMNWNDWLDVQNGADLRGTEKYESGTRFITTPRDLATYVHYDALYEAYLNACLFLLGSEAPFDPGIPFRDADWRDKQQGFAQFGGPHILSLVTEVATRALKAVRYQKFNLHRRLRPEAVGGLMHQRECGSSKEIKEIFEPVAHIVEAFNKKNCSGPSFSDRIKEKTGKTLLLPMAFPEGSPMHPSYGAGHGTVAGACVTILKAFFDTRWELPFKDKTSCKPVAYLSDSANEGNSLKSVILDRPLTLEGELNKIASNISIGRNWAGVHYFSDYIESIRLGEKIAIGILEEQKLTYGENFSMTVPLFDGGAIRI